MRTSNWFRKLVAQDDITGKAYLVHNQEERMVYLRALRFLQRWPPNQVSLPSQINKFDACPTLIYGGKMSRLWLNIKFGLWYLQIGEPKWWTVTVSKHKYAKLKELGSWFRVFTFPFWR